MKNSKANLKNELKEWAAVGAYALACVAMLVTLVWLIIAVVSLGMSTGSSVSYSVWGSSHVR